MKGPGLRIDLDVRRVWRCSKCGRIVRTLGQVTAQRCGCTSEAVQWMQLEPVVKKEPFRAPFREHLPEEWEIGESTEQLSVVSCQSSVVSQPTANPPQTPEPPAPEPAAVETAEDAAAESVFADESGKDGPAAGESAEGPAVPSPDAFGAGVEDAPRNPD